MTLFSNEMPDRENTYWRELFARAEVPPKKPPSFFRGGKDDSAGILVQSDLFTCDRARGPVA